MLSDNLKLRDEGGETWQLGPVLRSQRNFPLAKVCSVEGSCRLSSIRNLPIKRFSLGRDSNTYASPKFKVIGMVE